MKRTAFTKVAGSLLIIAILASGCASTTVLHTTPANADVYVKGQRLGETPYSYSDRKIAGASTLVTFKKEGYEDYNTSIRKNKRLNIGALISGLFFVYPLFWIMGYDEAHSYDLEKVEVSTQPVAVIEPAKTETQARVAPVKAPPDDIDLPTSSRVEKLLSQGQVDKAIEYAEEQEGTFQAGCFYTIAQYYLDKGDYANAKDFFNRSGKIKEGNVKIAEAMMKGEKRTEQNIPAENDARNLPAERGVKNLPAENPEMKLTGEDNRIIITVDSIVRSNSQPQDLVTALKTTNSYIKARPGWNQNYVLVYFNKTEKKALNLSGGQTLAPTTLTDQSGKNYKIILERGPSSVRLPGGGHIMWNPKVPHPYGVIISYRYMIFFIPRSSTPVRLNYVYYYKIDKAAKKPFTVNVPIDLVQ